MNTERISSEDWFSGAVLNDSARDDEFLSLRGGRINDARRGFRGGVKSGVGGLWTLGGVLGVDESVAVPFALNGAAGVWVSSDGFRECAGGVGGRSGRPIRFEVCLRVRGLRS